MSASCIAPHVEHLPHSRVVGPVRGGPAAAFAACPFSRRKDMPVEARSQGARSDRAAAPSGVLDGETGHVSRGRPSEELCDEDTGAKRPKSSSGRSPAPLHPHSNTSQNCFCAHTTRAARIAGDVLSNIKLSDIAASDKRALIPVISLSVSGNPRAKSGQVAVTPRRGLDPGTSRTQDHCLCCRRA